MFLRLIILSFFVFCVSYTVSSSTEVCFFNTGQGNCIAIRNEDKMVFIDCGASKLPNGLPLKKYIDAFRIYGKPEHNKLMNLIKGISECHFLTTHDHADHKNLVETINQIITQQNHSIKIIKHPFPKEIDGVDSVANFIDSVTGIFGGDVELIPMRPSTWTVNHAQNPEHDYNVMFKLKASSRNVLFMGDVSPQLFSKIYCDTRYRHDLDDIDILVGSHHGSNKSGELNLIDSIKPAAVIFCSNPKEIDLLPCDDALDLFFSANRDQPVFHHEVCSATRRMFVSSPVFTTCNSTGFYSLYISDSFVLFDGPGQVKLLENVLSSNRLNKRIKREMLQIEALSERCMRQDIVASRLMTSKRLAYCAKFPKIDERLFFNLSYLRHVFNHKVYEDILIVIIDTIITRDTNIKTPKSLGLYIKLLFEVNPKSSDYLSNSILTMLQHNIMFCDNAIAILDSVRAIPAGDELLGGFFIKLADITLEKDDLELHNYAKVLKKTIEWIDNRQYTEPNYNFREILSDRLINTLDREDAQNFKSYL